MAQRYSKVFSLTPNLYAEGSPVVIAAGALQRDNAKNEMLAQLKLRSVSGNTIKAVRVMIQPLDTVGRALGGEIRYDYLDLNAVRDAEFGQKSPIRFPDAATRAFTAAVSEVAFDDNSIWTCAEDAAWEPLPAPVQLEAALGDVELVKQYRFRFGGNTVMAPIHYKDLWFCTCGALDWDEEEFCHRCGQRRDQLLNCDMQKLAQERDERLAKEKEAQIAAEKAAEEARIAAEKAAAEKKAARQEKIRKIKKILKIAVPAAVGLAVALLLVFKLLIPTIKYNKAVELAEAGEQSDASGVDYAAIYALHEPDEVVMTVDGRDVTWAEYFYFFHNEAVGQENMFLTYQDYDMAVGWRSTADEEGHTYADLLGANAEAALCSFYLWEDVERESGAVLTEEEEQQMQAEHEGYISYFAGEGATEEDMFAVLQSENYMDETMYWRVMQKLYLQEPTFRAMMGENGEKASEEEVEAWAEENLPGYSVVSLDRIHISTLDPETNEPMDENAAAQQAALAQELAAQLQAVEDPMERVALFQKLKAQYDPEGISYVAVGSRIEAPIYEAAMALENGQISDPVEVDGDYYIILRRAFRADDVIDTGSGEQPVRELAAEDIFNQLMLDRQENQQVSYAEGFEPPRILDYYTSPVHTA